MSSAAKLLSGEHGPRPTAAMAGDYVAPRIRIAAGELIPGTPYRVERWLGEGGMGVVYEAEHVDIQQRVAVKLLRRGFCQDAAAVRAFRREATATGQLGTDNIVQVRDFSELADGRLLIAMELLTGRDLHAAIDGPMDPGRAIGILRQCCRALAVIHDSGLIHRDIKPENIFLTSEGGRRDKVKLLDFGISVFVDAEASDRLVGGTPGYLAPECILHAHVGPAADQFALGCVAYAMFTGTLVFTGDTTADILLASLEPAPSLGAAGVELPPGLEAVVARCLAADPSDRFENMRMVEAALCRAQIEAGLQSAWDDLPTPEVDPDERSWILANMPQPEAGLTRLRRRQAVAVAFLGALALGVVGVVAGATIGGANEERPTSKAVEEQTLAARAAAARALYVYPPVDAPGTPTAFRIVRALERLEGPLHDEAVGAATVLRREFGETLCRLGDEYWSAEGGKVFAVAYYEQALVFQPSIEPALTRSGMSEARRISFSERAMRADFSPLELVSAEPLTVLAKEDAQVRQREFATYRAKRASQLDSLDSKLSGLPSGASSPRSPSVEGKPAAPVATRVAESEPQPIEESGTPAGRAKSSAKDVARRGRTAFRAGNDDRARVLFEKALGIDGRNVEALAGLRDIYFDRGEYGRAIRYGKRAVRVEGRRASHQLRLGDAYYKSARYELAVTHYERARVLGASAAGVRLERARRRVP